MGEKQVDSELQGLFSGSILDRARRSSVDLLAEVVAGGSLDAAAAVEVYRGGYYARLRAQLEETYEALHWWLGDAKFSELSREFIGDHRSISPNLSNYGREFPAFLAGRDDLQSSELLAELGQFELSFAALFHTAEHTHVGQDSLAQIENPGTLRFVFGDAVVLAEYSQQVYRLWTLRKGARDELDTASLQGPERSLLYKRGGEIYADLLEEAPFLALALLADGRSLEEVLALVSEKHPGFDGAAVSSLFEQIFRGGIVSALKS
jgi:hypothetical protein